MKKKILALALAAALLCVAVVGTIAYLTDESDEVVNTFTVGNVKIVLDEAYVAYDEDNDKWVNSTAVDSNGMDRFGRVLANKYEDIYPGAVLPKDPTVVNVGSYDAYVRMDVKIPSSALAAFISSSSLEANNFDGFKAITSGGILAADDFTGSTAIDGQTCISNDSYALAYTSSSGIYTFTVYSLNPLTGADSTKKDSADIADFNRFTLFTHIIVPSDLTNEDLALISEDGFQMDIKAYAIQAKGFKDNPEGAFAALNEVYPIQ